MTPNRPELDRSNGRPDSSATDADDKLVIRLQADQWPVPAGLPDRVADRLLQDAAGRPLSRPSSRKMIMQRVVTGIGTAAVLSIVAAVFLAPLGSSSSTAYAAEFQAVADQVASAKTITWRKKVYWPKQLDEDGRVENKSTFGTLVEETHFYSAPDRHRIEERKDGQLTRVTVRNEQQKRVVILDVKHMSARFDESVAVGNMVWPPMHGAAAKLIKSTGLEPLKQDQFGEEQPTFESLAGFRLHKFEPQNQRTWGNDFWVDRNTKRLVGFRGPSLDILDPRKTYGPEDRPAHPIGFFLYDVRYDVQLDDDLFSTEIPEGYVREASGKLAEVTEAEIVDYLSILAELNDGVFPGLGPNSSDEDVAAILSRTNAILKRRSNDEPLTAVEQEWMALSERYMVNQYRGYGPFSNFFEQRADRDSWRFIGKGVRLGTSDQIVAWYRLKSGQWRVIYGDMRVLNVDPSELPLPVL